MAANVENRRNQISSNEKSASVVSDQSAADEDAQENVPIVFQCKECRAIIGDSLSWICVDRDLRSFTLKRVTEEVVKSPKMLTSCDEYDLGSTYYQLKCKTCGRQLGRMYTTTPRHLDELRDLYTLLAETVSSYQLGNSAGQNDVNTWIRSFPTMQELVDKLHQTQTVVLTLNQRLKSLEEAAGMSSSQNTIDSAAFHSTPTNRQSPLKVNSTPAARREMSIYEHGHLELSQQLTNRNPAKDDDAVMLPQTTTKRKLAPGNAEMKTLAAKKSRSGR